MQGFKFFRKSKKNKTRSTDDSPEPSPPTTPSANRNTPTRAESSLSTQSTPVSRIRPFSEDYSTSPPSSPTSKSRPISEAILTATNATPTTVGTGSDNAEPPALKPANPPLDRSVTAPVEVPSQASQATTVVESLALPGTLALAPESTETPPAKAVRGRPSTPFSIPQSAETTPIKAPSANPSASEVSALPTPATIPYQEALPVEPTRAPTQTATAFDLPRTPTRSVDYFPSMAARVSSPGALNGLNGANGVFSPPLSPKGVFRPKGRLSSFGSSQAPSGGLSRLPSYTRRPGAGAGGYKIGHVQESTASLKKRSITELGAGVYRGISNKSYVGFLEWIRSERLTTLPHKGSRWDKVLIRALYFAEQLHRFDVAIQGFALDSSAAAAIGYGHAQLLLEIGHENSEAG